MLIIELDLHQCPALEEHKQFCKFNLCWCEHHQILVSRRGEQSSKFHHNSRDDVLTAEVTNPVSFLSSEALCQHKAMTTCAQVAWRWVPDILQGGSSSSHWIGGLVISCLQEQFHSSSGILSLCYVCVCVCMFSHVWPFATPWTVACQPLSLKISRQEYWSEMAETNTTLGSNHLPIKNKFIKNKF